MCAHCAEKDSLILSLKQANNDIALFLAGEKSRQDAMDAYADDIASAMLDEKRAASGELPTVPDLPYIARHLITTMH